jgi:hypothetical protein
MDKKSKIVFLSLIAIAAYGTIFVYQRAQRKKADEKVVSYDEALKILSDK